MGRLHLWDEIGTYLVTLLGGSWGLVTIDNWIYKPT